MSKYLKNIRYDSSSQSAFTKTLLNRVDAYFKQRGSTRKANNYMWFKVLFFFTAFFGLWGTLAFIPMPMLLTSLLIILFAIITMCMAFTVAHDAVHNTLSKNKTLNNVIYWISFNLLGPNAYLWKIRHNNAHHFFVNIPGSDIDLESTDILRISPHTKWRPFQKYQYLYAPILYSIFTLHWILFKDFKLYFMKSFGNVTNLSHHPFRFIELILMKGVYLGYMVAIPYSMLPYSLSTIIIAFVGFHLFLSTVLLIIFASSHVSTGSHFVAHDKEALVHHSFYEHQLLTSVDFCPTNPLVSFFLGGFNSHVAHHMFPNICSIHYVGISHIIRDTAKEHGLPYQERGFFQIWYEHFVLLKEMGQDPMTGRKYFILPQNPDTENFSENFDKDSIESPEDSSRKRLSPYYPGLT